MRGAGDVAFPGGNDSGHDVQWSVVACEADFGVAGAAVDDSRCVHVACWSGIEFFCAKAFVLKLLS